MNEQFQPNDGVAATLPTAQELALAKNPIDLAVDTTEVFACIRNSKPLRWRPVDISAQTIDTFAFLVEQDLADEKLLGKLRDLNTRMVAIHEKMTEFSPSKVNEFLFKKRDEIHAQVVAGQEPSEAPSREHVQQNFQIRRAGLLNQLTVLTHSEVVPLVKPILQKFASALEESMRDMEVETRELCKAYGLPYEPAYLWRAAATVAARTALRLPSPNAWATPAHLLANLVTL